MTENDDIVTDDDIVIGPYDTPNTLSITERERIVWTADNTRRVATAKKGDTFFDVCKVIGESTPLTHDDWPLFWIFLGTEYGPESSIGQQCPEDTFYGATISDPWGEELKKARRKGNKKRKNKKKGGGRRPRSRMQTRLREGTKIPYPEGCRWDLMKIMRDTVGTSFPSGNDGGMTAVKEAEVALAIWTVVEQEVRDKRELRAYAAECKTDWEEEAKAWDLSPYIGEDGRIKAPANLLEAKLRPDWKRWEEAYESEREMIMVIKRVLTEPWSKEMFRKKGIRNKPTPLVAIYEVKYENGKVRKYKCRMVLRGTEYFVRPDISFSEKYSASPNVVVARLLMAIMVLRGMF